MCSNTTERGLTENIWITCKLHIICITTLEIENIKRSTQAENAYLKSVTPT